jgi:hypothetical protein
MASGILVPAEVRAGARVFKISPPPRCLRPLVARCSASNALQRKALAMMHRGVSAQTGTPSGVAAQAERNGERRRERAQAAQRMRPAHAHGGADKLSPMRALLRVVMYSFGHRTLWLLFTRGIVSGQFARQVSGWREYCISFSFGSI